MKLSIPTNSKNQLFASLKKANLAFQELYPGDRTDRQPIHTVYGGANLFKYDMVEKLGQAALDTFKEYAQ